ncbi:Reticulon-domain-containing protein [Thelonectria olida]|uniref:Reticulon-domain-containing protein n=1 Tax=Thelonectria olida TaxID=1576542 RepID=A0A9P8VSC2_9HYPO|nr:Reticulon-domain-containing protein [Thelonectria olida]
MSGPAYVVMPVQVDGAQHESEADIAKLASAIQQSLDDKTHSGDHGGQRDTGPLKEIIAHQDSLYKYLSWEDPVRTLGSYLGLLSFLFGIHYLPLTQLALKSGAVTLGVISLTESAGRVFGPNTFFAHLRPKEYKKIPESTLNATLKDIHDLIQYAAVQVQRIILGQDLDQTFAAFLGFTALYWLIKVISPFGLAVLGLTSLYIAPLVTSTRGREVARDAKLRSEELANAATDKGVSLAQDGKAKAAELSHKARDSGIDMGRRVEDLAYGGKEKAADLSTQAMNTASNVSSTIAETARKLPEMGSNAINQTSGTVKSAVSDARQYIHSSQPGATDGKPDATSAGNTVSQLSSSAIGTARQMAPGSNITHRAHYPEPALEHLDDTVYAMPGQTAGEKTGSVAGRDSTYSTAGDTAATHGIAYRT